MDTLSLVTGQGGGLPRAGYFHNPAAEICDAAALRGMAPPRPCILLMADTHAQMLSLIVTLQITGAEFICARSLAELSRACRQTFALAVVAVDPRALRQTLEIIRQAPEQKDLPVLVAADRVRDNPELAGVLPAFRAMPCGQTDLLTLARRRLRTTPHNPRPRRLL